MMRLQKDITAEAQAGLLPIAAKVFWWGTPQEALGDINRFAAQVMTYGDWNDVQGALHWLGSETLENVLDQAPPGIFDPKSWNYWHLYFGRTKVPPLPQRRLLPGD